MESEGPMNRRSFISLLSGALVGVRFIPPAAFANIAPPPHRITGGCRIEMDVRGGVCAFATRSPLALGSTCVLDDGAGGLLFSGFVQRWMLLNGRYYVTALDSMAWKGLRNAR